MTKRYEDEESPCHQPFLALDETCDISINAQGVFRDGNTSLNPPDHFGMGIHGVETMQSLISSL